MILDLVIIGGGASGFMGAITAISSGLRSVVILEGTSKVLEKVRISGGGRCNITNSCLEISDLVNNYPRGEKQLIGLFNRFSTTDAFYWFQNKGLSLKIENDGRVFPCSDSSEDVVKCLTVLAKTSGVKGLCIMFPVMRGSTLLISAGSNNFQGGRQPRWLSGSALGLRSGCGFEPRSNLGANSHISFIVSLWLIGPI